MPKNKDCLHEERYNFNTQWILGNWTCICLHLNQTKGKDLIIDFLIWEKSNYWFSYFLNGCQLKRHHQFKNTFSGGFFRGEDTIPQLKCVLSVQCHQLSEVIWKTCVSPKEETS